MSTEQDPGTDHPPLRPGEDPLVAPREEAGSEVAPGSTSSSSEIEFPPPAEDVSADTSSAAAFQERPRRHSESPNMLPAREVRRSGAERLLVRLIATCGIVAIGVAIAAIMVSSNSQGWLVGLVVSVVTVILAALLWSSRML